MSFTCLNCGSPVREKFCPRCGQGREDRRGPLMALFGDFLSEFFSLDGRLMRTVPTALIFFVPILALALKLLYVRRPFYYVDHLVFAFHFQSFLFLTLVVAFLLNQVGMGRLYPGLFTYLAAVLLVAPTYLVFALKRVYKQSW